MGWLSYPATHYKDGYIDRLAEVRAILDTSRIVKDAMVGSVYYAAARNDDGKVYGAVVLTYTEDNKRFGYKCISSDMGPYHHDCPSSILKLITADDEYTVAWVRDCMEYAERKKRAKKLKSANAVKVKLPFDTNFSNKGDEVVLVRVTKNVRGRNHSFWKVSDRMVRMGRNTMNLLFTEFPESVEVLND